MERMKATDLCSASVGRAGALKEIIGLHGVYHAACFDRNGVEKWRDVIHNTVTTEGKNFALDTVLAGSAYTVTGPYMGLISGTSFSAIAAGDTAAQINGSNGWKEAGSAFNPTFTARIIMAFNAAGSGSKSLSSALTFTITSTGPDTVKGAFVVLGTGAVVTIANTSGKLLSAGLFASGDKSVSSGDTVNVSWSLSA